MPTELKFTEFAVDNTTVLRDHIQSLRKTDVGAENAKELDALSSQDSLSLKDLRILQRIVAAVKSGNDPAANNISWLHEVLQPKFLRLPKALPTQTKEEIAAQNRAREVLMARAQEREYQQLVEPLNRRATNQKRKQMYEKKLQYQLGVPMNMIAGAATAFLVGYYGGMHYFVRDHSRAVGAGCVCMVAMLLLEMTLFTIRSI